MQSKLNKKSIDQLIAMCAHNDEQEVFAMKRNLQQR